jgi:hypothetical protein
VQNGKAHRRALARPRDATGYALRSAGEPEFQGRILLS